MVECQPDKISGILSKIVYKNPDNDYFIGKMLSEEDAHFRVSTQNVLVNMSFAKFGQLLCYNLLNKGLIKN